jgi:hypothetical protein
MGNRKLNISPELAEVWETLYVSGYSINDIRATESAKGRSTGDQVIKRELKNLGVEFRTQEEAVLLAASKRHKP